MQLNREILENDRVWGQALKDNQLVYAMQQVNYLKVAGIPLDKEAFYSSGICLGVSTWWIELRKHGKDYAHRDFICHDISLKTLFIQEEYENSEDEASYLKFLGLSLYKSETLKDWNGLYKLLPLNGGFALFLSQDHAMAIQTKGSHLHFLDPNYGHFRFNSVGALQKVLSKINILQRYKLPYRSHHLH